MTLLQFYIGIRIAFVKSTCCRAAAELASTPHRPAAYRDIGRDAHLNRLH